MDTTLIVRKDDFTEHAITIGIWDEIKKIADATDDENDILLFIASAKELK